jgi:DNA-binding NarL/FixJ family response regulator
MLRLDDAARMACKDEDQSLGLQPWVIDGTAVPGRAGDLLIIEDHAMVLGVLQTSLRRLCPHAEQVCVSNARAALEIIGRAWLRVFIDPDSLGADEALLVRELQHRGLAPRCCLITTRPRRRMKQRLRELECLTCINTRMPIEEFHEALARRALGITAPRDKGRDNPGPRVTARHAELLRLLQRGLQNKAIARELGIAEGTVRNHLHSLMKRLGVRNRMQAAQEAARIGIT